MKRADQQQHLKAICQQQDITVSDAAVERICAASDAVADAIAVAQAHASCGSLFDTEPAALASVLVELAAAESANE